MISSFPQIYEALTQSLGRYYLGWRLHSLRVLILSLLIIAALSLALAKLVQADTAYAIQSAINSPVYNTFTPTGATQTHSGNNADCEFLHEKPPSNGSSGNFAAEEDVAIESDVTSPTYGTALSVTSTGSNGTNGGNGGSCYAGYAGGAGGAGGVVTATLNSGYTTNTVGSGLNAQSFGGAGGNGGTTDDSFNGGNGGNGGAGGALTITNYGNIITSGSSTDSTSTTSLSFGMYGLSMGGSGGTGGNNTNPVYGDGGNGNSGGLGGVVTLINDGSISTAYGYAMFGLSVGGVGGNSGNSAGYVPDAYNTSAGYGGVGGDVVIDNNGMLQTNYFGMAGMFGISVGGGGGDSGRSSSLQTLGGTGGSGAYSGELTLSNAGEIQTLSTSSIGMLALAVGGGGGQGGLAAGGGGVKSTNIGGDGGGGGDGGTIQVSNTGEICTGGACASVATELGTAITTAITTYKAGGNSSGSGGTTIASGLAPAIAAISNGGGGGLGGSAFDVSAGASTSIGGAGGSGGNGGTVLANNTGLLSTMEVASSGLFAASIGGGGGSGGGAGAVSASTVGNPTMSSAIGGSGGAGGYAGTVGINCSSTSASLTACTNAPTLSTLTSGALISTLGDHSPGLHAVAIGGGGGTGGNAVALSASLSVSNSLSIGGSGGSGGEGGEIYVDTADVPIITIGTLSTGVKALSVGGGGGSGGSTYYRPDFLPGGSVALISSSESIGGTGGSGGVGESITINNTSGVIATFGDLANGILGISVGGGGGHGGVGIGAGVGIAAMSTSIGGNGGSGGDGGDITITNASKSSYALGPLTAYGITVFGNDSSAIEALSIGGGGGRGGWSGSADLSTEASLSVTVGGNGGNSGDGGIIAITNSGILETRGLDGVGILGISAAMGGGSGGSSLTGDVSVASMSSSVGGNGGSGGTGGNVIITNLGDISTGLTLLNLNSQAIVALSHGGGGGRGGISASGSLSVGGSFSDTVGGGSAGGGTGGIVNVTNEGLITAFGALSNGIVAISTGGRGGLGGIAISASSSLGAPADVTIGSDGGDGGKGGAVTVDNYGVVATTGFRSHAISAQSTGGHGGMGGISIGTVETDTFAASSNITLGGTGGKGGTGGSVTIDNYANALSDHSGGIYTVGPFSVGLLAHSIGGDGGIGGIGLGWSLSVLSPSMTLGGTGGGGATGGSATISSTGTVETYGLFSAGIVAQSIGGNGGMAGATIAKGSASRSGTTAITQGNSGGSGANAGSVTIDNSGVVTTSGALSAGVVGESIGGGGGRSGVAMNLDILSTTLNNQTSQSVAYLGSSGGGGGNGGSVNITQTGSISTQGYQSEALYAGSVGGGGGTAGSFDANLTYGSKNINLTIGGQQGSSGNAGSVTVTNNGDISTAGPYSHGIYAQAVGGGGGNGSILHSQEYAGGIVSGVMSLGSNSTDNNSAGQGGTVDLSIGAITFSTIETTGYGATAIFGQSVGGGGGQAASGLISSQLNIDIPLGSILSLAGGALGPLGSILSLAGGALDPTSTEPSKTFSVQTGSSTTEPSASVTSPCSSTAVGDTCSSSFTAGSAAAITLGGFNANTNQEAGVVTINNFAALTTSSAMSDAIKLQSIGGGGGFGAFVDVYSGSPFAASSSYLGGGGKSGYGASITATNGGAIVTEQAGSLGILAQSIGGGGGDARALSIAYDQGLFSGFTASLGNQSGGGGGVGGTVSITNSGSIQSQGDGSDGIVAQSIGGGGGHSKGYGSGISPAIFATTSTESTGLSMAGTYSNNVGSVDNFALAGFQSSDTNSGTYVASISGASMAAVLGSANSNNNNSAATTVTNSASIATAGIGSGAITAQSIGGGGGIVHQHLNNYDQSQTSLALMLGAVDKGYGNSDTVSIDNSGTINTNNRGAMGILGQSIGGGGGLAILTETTIGYGGSASVSLIMGGAGSSKGAAESITVTSSGSITTLENLSEAIVAQAISNGGGVTKVIIDAAESGTQWSTSNIASVAEGSFVTASANSGLAIAAVLGNSSSENQNTNSVTVTSSSNILTNGFRSSGIVAQSIASGGGLVDITTSSLNGGNFNGAITLGGQSTVAGSVVAVTSSGAISTGGEMADGILAQSIGGGGGSFGIAHINATQSGDGQLAFQLGSNAFNSQQYSDAVTVNVTNSISTAGPGSTGITAQSLGLGGGLLAFQLSNVSNLSLTGNLGSVANNIGNAGAVEVTSTASISSSGDYAHLIVAQSIGAGGGRLVGMTNVAPSTEVTLGASTVTGSPGGYGGTVTVNTSGSLQSSGAHSHGIVAQAIGGGGGLIDLSASEITFGTTSNSKGTGGVVNIDQTGGSVATFGSYSAGIIAQSIGGGGGLAVLSNPNSSVTFGGGNSQDGYTVNLNLNGSTQTSGIGSPGVMAVSIGGGGGIGFASSASSSTDLPSVVGGSGDTGDINITLASTATNMASITTKGAGSDALVASTIPNGGGLWIQGDQGIASTLQESDYGGRITIVVNGYSDAYPASISSSAATTLLMLGGCNCPNDPSSVTLSNSYSSITNNGYLNADKPAAVDSTTDNPNNYWAIYSPYTYNTITNYGTIVGNINLGSYGEMFNYGTLQATSMYVANNSFHNYGNFYPGGYKNTSNVLVSGSLKSYTGSNIYVDVDILNAGAKNDSITVTGLAQLAGQFVPQAKTILPGPYTFIQAGTLTDHSSILDTLVFDWNSTVVSGNQMVGTPTANFMPVGYSLTGNQNSVASYLQQTWGKSDSGLAGLFGYIHEYQQGDQSSYQYALNQISAPSLNSQAIQMQTQFATSLGESMTCSNMTPKRIDANKDDCEWARLVGDRTTQNENSNNAGYTSSGGGIRLGAQRNLWDNVTTGYAIGYTRNYLSTSGFNSNGDFLDGSFSLKKKMGNWSLGGSAALSQGWFENKRQLMLYGNGVADSLAAQYTSNSYMGTAGIRARMAYEYEQKTHYLKPYVDFDYFYSFTPSYDESGSGALALSVGSSSHSGTTVTPMLEFGADLTTDSKRRIKAFVSAGASFLNNNSHTSQASFIGALSNSGTFNVVTNGPSLLGRVNVGIELFESNNIQGRITYGLLTGDSYQSQNWSANLGYQF
jgi:hypothetical protein